MRYQFRKKDFRRVGYVFDDDPFKSIPEGMSAMDWKLVNSENENGAATSSLEEHIKQSMVSSLDSGIQQEYNSDDEPSNSICKTLNELTEHSKEVCNSIFSVNHIGDMRCHTEQTVDRLKVKNGGDALSVKSSNSEANNLVEEVFISTNNSAEKLQNMTLGMYDDHNPNFNRYLSYSADNIRKVNNFDERSFQSLSTKSNLKSCINNRNQKNVIQKNLEIIIAIDIGTTFSGYAYAIDDYTNGNLNFMNTSKELNMRKLPSILLLNNRMEFHSFGYDAKDYFLNIEQNLAPLSAQWLLFEKFKLQLANNLEINRDSEIKSTNGTSVPALTVYSRTLNYFKCQALQDISNFLQIPIKRDNVRWVLTIPVMWSVSGKLFMQEAAFNAGLCTPETSKKVTILYEPDATAVWCTSFCLQNFLSYREIDYPDSGYFMVANFGGGTVDITIHRVPDNTNIPVIEVVKPPETLCASLSINDEFVQLLSLIFGDKFISKLKSEVPASFLDILLQFEYCKCTISDINRTVSSANIFIGSTVTDMYKKLTGNEFEETLTSFGHDDIMWNDQGAICMNSNLMTQLFQRIIRKTVTFIDLVIQNRTVEKQISRVYFVGGLAKSEIFRNKVEENFRSTEVSIFFPKNSVTYSWYEPYNSEVRKLVFSKLLYIVHTETENCLQEAELCVLKGAAQKCIEINSIKYRKVLQSFAVGVIKPFQDNLHPPEKLFVKNGRRWCNDILDWLVRRDQVLPIGEIILKRYTPAHFQQSQIVINVYTIENECSQFITDDGVHSCGVLSLTTSSTEPSSSHEILLQFTFVGDEFVANMFDTATGTGRQCYLDRLSFL